ncbi:MAG: hypothetical protein H0U69_00830 [Trueperaceae bacterium]|nr:hypothetical protein [Trueperaceae bacterium]
MDTLPDGYRYRGARALVILHERHMRHFLRIWHDADAADIALPETPDEDYASRAALLRHVLRAAGRYLVWTSEQLGLPDPAIEEPPEAEAIAEGADAYLEHVLERWRTPLADVPEERFGDRTYPVWGVSSTIEGVLEHAVVHPLRHTFQLEELLADRLT